MRQSIRLAATFALALTLAACNKTPPPAPTHAFVKKGVTMKLDPPAAPDCKPTTAYHATLSWTVDPGVASKTDVHIEKPDGNLFARSNDQTAHADTGDWVKPGMWFVLVDRRSGEVLGSVQAGPQPCP